MANVKDNKRFYDEYNWSAAGEEWSLDWGSTFNFWYATLLPRIGVFLPAARIVEIGCGYGRISRFLGQHCERLQLIDITRKCIDHCNQQFASDSHISAAQNDGLHLDSVDDDSVDFILSIYSLVHADAMTMQSYLGEAARVLARQGVCFIHHSNCEIYRGDPSINPEVINDFRDTSVSAQLVQQWADAEGLACIRQELLNWGLDTLLSDCFSVVVRKGSHWEQSLKEYSNPCFYDEMKYYRRLSDHYQTLSPEKRG
jgi:SAM-dependent methyltransferase